MLPAAVGDVCHVEYVVYPEPRGVWSALSAVFESFPRVARAEFFLGVVGVVLHPAHGYRKVCLSEVRRAHGQVEFSGRNRTGLREHFVEAEKPSRPAGSVPEQRDGERPVCAHRPKVVEARLVGVLHGLVGKGGKFGAPELFPALFVVGEYPAKAFLQNAFFELRRRRFLRLRLPKSSA